MEKYSVLMSLYHKEKAEYLKKSLDSMINQTVKPDQIVMVYDGPLTDALYQTMNEYISNNHDLFTIVKNEKNIGLGLSLNKGLAECRNELVARMDTDDISFPDRCRKQLLAFEKRPELSIIGSAVDEFKEDITNVTGRRVVPSTNKDIYNFARRRSAFNHPSVMYRKSKVLEFNGYSNLRRNQDVDLFGRMLFGGCKDFNFTQSLLWFRSDDNLSKRRKSWENTWSYIDTIKRFWKMGFASFFDYITIAVAQTGMYLMPIKLQNLVYKKFLRK